MQLYDLKNSPFATRVRILIRHKKLPIESVAAPHALRTAEFKEAFILGKLPILSLDDNSYLAESTVIMEYLESKFPQSALIPKDALKAAHNSTLIRFSDNHLPTGLMPLFMALYADKETQAGVSFDALHVELEKLERLLSELPDFRERSLQTGDLCLVTLLYFAIDLAERFTQLKLLEMYPVIKAWWIWVHEFNAVEHEMNVLVEAHEAFADKLTGN